MLASQAACASWEVFELSLHLSTLHMGPEDPSNENKKCPSFFLKPNFSEIARRFQKSKSTNWEERASKVKAFSHFSSWEKRHSSGQKWFLRPYFRLIRGMFMFLLRSDLRFLFQALEVPEPRVRKRPLSLREGLN